MAQLQNAITLTASSRLCNLFLRKQFSICTLSLRWSYRSLRKIINNVSIQYPSVQKVDWTFCRVWHFRLFTKQSIITDLSQKIDVEELKTKHRIEKLMKSKSVPVSEMLEAELKQLCDETIENFTELELRKLKIIKLEHDFLFSEGYAIPSSQAMSSRRWLEALAYPDLEARLEYYLRMEETEALLGDSNDKKDFEKAGDEEQTKYLLCDSYLCQKRKWGDYKLSSAMQFGPPLIIDMDYTDSMAVHELKHTAQQLWALYNMNGNHCHPFHLVMASCSRTNATFRNFELGPMLDCSHFLATVTKEDATQLFCRKEIIYLSPYAKNVMKAYDPNAVYVIAAYHNSGRQRKLCYPQAMKQKVRCMRLPINEHVRWRHGSKDLTLDCILSVLLMVKEGFTWKQAFKASLPSSYLRLT